MRQERGYRGWAAAWIVTLTISLVLLAVDKYLAQHGEDFWDLAQRVTEKVAGKSSDKHGRGIRLEVDPGLVATNPITPNKWSLSQRTSTESTVRKDLLRRPPELVATVSLREPLASDDFVSLPLSHRSSSMSMLLDQLSAALASPITTVGHALEVPAETPIDSDSLYNNSARSPNDLVGKMPAPERLLADLEILSTLATETTPVSERIDKNIEAATESISLNTSNAKAAKVHRSIAIWSQQVQQHTRQLVMEIGLEHPNSSNLLSELDALSLEGQEILAQLEDESLFVRLSRASYGLQRHLALWSALQKCVAGKREELSSTSTDQPMSKAQIAAAVQSVEAYLGKASDRQGWRSYLLLDGLSEWSANSQEQWRQGNQLAKSFRSRISWVRLDDKQQAMMQHPSVQHLAECLATWSRDPVDYRHLLASIEQIEQDETSRHNFTVADTIQTLRHAKSDAQKQLAEALNTHYRNANLRLTISQQVIERFLPDTQHEIRPVRQRILGADTAGNSEVHTKLSVKFNPDPHAWNVDLGITGNLVSTTQSSRGPAVFHNAGAALVDSSRNLKMTPAGYQLYSRTAQVSSTSQLQKMSTDFDGLPVVGDFVRLVAREQFNQKRGLARRITERIIAQETDAEFDKKLNENLQLAERELNSRILGPLQRLTLDPMVVSMSTTSDRLSVRYRLAHDMQLTAHSPRPRAPADCLTSFQLHQSVINNTIDRVGLPGRNWPLKELYRSLGEVFQAQWTPPEDIPDDITIRFADHRPITTIMDDGKLRLQLRIANFQRNEGINVSNFTVTSTYIPLADGLHAGLVRDPEGTIEIQAKHLPVKDRLALRVIFSKVFVSQPEIPLIAEQWRQDKRAQGLAVSQLEIRDGWLAVAISDQSSPLAAEVADRAREALNSLR